MLKADCALVTEPWIHKGCVKGLEKWNVHCKGNKPRAAVVTRKELKAQILDKYSNDDITSITISTEAGQVILVSFYWDINVNTLSELLSSITEHCQVNGCAMIIGMDSNAHGELWGCKEENARGTTLTECRGRFFKISLRDKPQLNLNFI
jgi:hypothetical protein